MTYKETRFLRSGGVGAATFVMAVLALSATALAQDTKPDAPATKPADLPTPDELMAKHIEKAGGAEKYRQLKSQKMTGTMSLPAMEINGTMTVMVAEPNKMLNRMTITGFGDQEQGYNGKVGWAIDPAQGPMIIEGEMLEQLETEAIFNSELKYAETYPERETMEKTEFDSRPAYKVRQVSEAGHESFTYFDAETGFVIGHEQISQTPMGEIPITTAMRDYMEFDGIMLPTTLDMEQMGMQILIKVETIETNSVDDSVFETPAAIKALLEARDGNDESADDAG